MVTLYVYYVYSDTDLDRSFSAKEPYNSWLFCVIKAHSSIVHMIQGGEDPYDALVATHFRKRATNYRVLLRKMTYGEIRHPIDFGALSLHVIFRARTL